MNTVRAGLRRATPADAGAVRDLTRAAYAKWVPVIDREPKPMTADYGVAIRDHMVELLHLDGELIAVIEMQSKVESPSHRERCSLTRLPGPWIWPCAPSSRGRTRPITWTGGGASLHER